MSRFVRLLLVLALLAVPAWGDGIDLHGFGAIAHQKSSPLGAFNNVAFIVPVPYSFEVLAGNNFIPAPESGSGIMSDPFLYSGGFWPLWYGGHWFGPDDFVDCSLTLPPDGQRYCAILYITSARGYFSDLSTFHFAANIRADIDPLYYRFAGPPILFTEGIGTLTLDMTKGGENEFAESWGGTSMIHIDPVPEPATMLLLGSGLLAAAWRRR